ncbi:MAG: 16S rRNA (cytosine(1402)-N(4))-methyltransferase RsmH [Myxococcota bacterium]
MSGRVGSRLTGRIYHIPVMAEAVVALLAAAPAGVIVDGTLGGAGHSAALVEATDRLVVGVDQDPDALHEASQRMTEASAQGRFKTLHGNFRDLPALLESAELPGEQGLAGILLDLGVSSHQLDEASRGFAFRFPDAPLDMRMNPSEDCATARDLLETLDAVALMRVLREYGEVPRPDRVARAIKQAVADETMETTGDLARVVEKAVPPRRSGGVHPATTVFQALRIAVNKELEALDEVLTAAEQLLKPGGRLAVIAYHSLEDRRVKQHFRRGEQGPARPGHLPPPSDWVQTWQVVTSKALKASPEEIVENPRARSARLRVAARPMHAGGAV